MLNKWFIRCDYHPEHRKYFYMCHVLKAYHRDGSVSHIYVDRELFLKLTDLNVMWSVNKKTGYAFNNRYGYLHHIALGLLGADKFLVVDHINRNKLDNRALNLRLTTRAFNTVNQLRSNNPLGCTGVYFNGRKYVVHLCNKHLGTYADLDEAIQVRKQAEENMLSELNGVSSSSSISSSSDCGEPYSESSTDSDEDWQASSDGDRKERHIRNNVDYLKTSL